MSSAGAVHRHIKAWQQKKPASPLIMSNMVVRCLVHVMVKQVLLHGTKQVVADATTYSATNTIYSDRGTSPVLSQTLTVLLGKHTGLQQHASPAA